MRFALCLLDVAALFLCASAVNKLAGTLVSGVLLGAGPCSVGTS